MRSKTTTPKLSDYEVWLSLNRDKDFNMLDYLYGVYNQKSLAPDIFVAFLKLYWPEFIEKDGHVFLKSSYSNEKYFTLINNGSERKEVEYWLNILEIDSFFSDSGQFRDDSEFFEFSTYLGNKIKKIWHSKLKIEFPEKSFKVECLTDADTFEVFVVFYQCSAVCPVS